MSYKLLIVDDEEIIREGLNSLVNWKSLGFQVVQCLEDGKNAIEYIEQHPVDVILADIRMTFVTGLELAAYVYSRKPHIKVVIISGYKDFEYAKQAISYNVVHYMLKPTSMEEVNQVFRDIREQLDREREAEEQRSRERQQYNELLPLMQEQLITDLLMGAIRNKAEIEKKVKLLNMNLDIEYHKCSVMKLHLNSYDKYLDNSWEYGKDGFFTAIRNLLKEDEEGLAFFPLNYKSGRILVLAVDKLSIENETLQTRLLKKFDKINNAIEKIFGISMEMDFCQPFQNIYELAVTGLHEIPPDGVKDKEIKSIISSGDYIRISEQQKLLVTYITSGNSEAVNSLFDSIIDDLRDTDTDVVQNFLLELFSLLCNRLKSLDIDVYEVTKGAFNYNMVLKLKDIRKLQTWGRNLLNEITGYLDKHREASERNVIIKAKEYIRENYNKDISLDDVAEHVYLSTVYFSRVFKLRTGENFIDYLIKVRMEKAKELLQNPKYKAYEVGLMVGYKSMRYFSRVFKRYSGLNPSEYRNSFLKEGVV